MLQYLPETVSELCFETSCKGKKKQRIDINKIPYFKSIDRLLNIGGENEILLLLTESVRLFHPLISSDHVSRLNHKLLSSIRTINMQ